MRGSNFQPWRRPRSSLQADGRRYSRAVPLWNRAGLERTPGIDPCFANDLLSILQGAADVHRRAVAGAGFECEDDTPRGFEWIAKDLGVEDCGVRAAIRDCARRL